tara:strand:- start:182 stop:970 length:789 start_codon:yes stop_codon:yes gene_type:complete
MKYLGGKQRLGKEIAPILLEFNKYYGYENYLEPFCGALGVLTHMSPYFDNIVASDYHPDLIKLWKGVKDGSFVPPNSISEDRYNKIKESKSPSALKGFAGFSMSFGGRFFTSYAPNYANGKNENFCREGINSINRKRPQIQNVEFKCQDYRTIKPNKYLIYCDPPYTQSKYPIKYRRDTKYYDVFDNDEFWEIMRDWSKNNLVIISELRAPPDFHMIWSKEKVNTASKAGKTTLKNINEIKLTEKLFIHNSNLINFDLKIKS